MCKDYNPDLVKSASASSITTRIKTKDRLSVAIMNNRCECIIHYNKD